MTKKIKLTRGKFALVDEEDYDYLSEFKWFAHFDGNCWYAVRSVVIDGKKSVVRMHRYITDARPSFQVDHKNGNGLDNRRINLRKCSHAMNAKNRKINSDNTSGFKGVGFSKQHGKWRVRIGVDGKSIFLGLFEDAKSAFNKYVKASKKFHGEFSRTN